MLAVTNTNAFSSLTLVEPPVNIGLTTTLVDDHISGSIVINSTITTALNTLLKSILGNKNVKAEAITRVAKYSGFSPNTGTTPHTITFSSGNISLDKLTFYVMFRLPYTSDKLTYQDIGNGNTSSTIELNPTGWGKYANHIRTLSGTGLKKLNQAGVNFDTPNDYYTTLSGYNDLGALYQEDGYSEFQTALFDHSKAENKIPVSFYRLAQDENAYKLYKNVENYRIHWPDRIESKSQHKIDFFNGRVYFEREVSLKKVGANNSLSSVTLDDIKELMKKRRYVNISNLGNFVVSVDRVIYRVVLKDTEDMFFDLKDCELIYYEKKVNEELKKSHNGDFRVFARKPDPAGDVNGIAMPVEYNIETKEYIDKRRYWIERYKSKSKSGLTFGIGVDIGSAFTHQRKTSFEINFLETVTSFKICLGRQKSNVIEYSTQDLSSTLQAELVEIITKYTENEGKKDKEATTNTIGSLMITVSRQANNINYNVLINWPRACFYPNFFYSTSLAIQIIDKTTLQVIRDGFLDDWKLFKKMIIQSMGVNVVSEDFSWIDSEMSCYSLAGITGPQNQIDFQNTIKELFGVKGSLAWVTFRNKFDFIRKFSFGVGANYIFHLRSVYNLIFKSKHESGAINNVITKLEVNHKTAPTNSSQALARMNEVEKYVLFSRQYNGASGMSYSSMALAINSHDIELLKKIVNGVSWANKTAGPTNKRGEEINEFIDKCKLKLYRDVE